MDFEAEEIVLTKNLLNDGTAKDYSGATYIGTIAALALLWN